MIGIRMVVISVSGLRLSLSRSRRMIARVFMVSSARLRHSRADQEVHLLGGFIAEVRFLLEQRGNRGAITVDVKLDTIRAFNHPLQSGRGVERDYFAVIDD